LNRIELYSAEDIRAANDKKKKRLMVFIVLCALATALFVVATILRLRIPGIAILAVLACVGYFFFSSQVMPYVRYCRYLKEMNEGLSRETEGCFASISGSLRMVDGVEVNDFVLLVDEGETDERLFLWDVDKPRPDIPEGQRIRVTSHSNFIKALEFI